MGDFVHLHLHTEYSLLDGAAKISEIADKAIKEGQSAVAITDHGAMFGAVEFYNSLKAKGVKPIIGCEVYVAPESRFIKEGKQHSSGHHLVLLAKNAAGYKNLSYMVSESYINGFYTRPRIDMELLSKHSEGLIALSACVAGKIPQLILSGNMPEAEKYALQMKDIFGEDFYLEIQNHGLEEERKVAYGIRILSEKLGIPMVATNDVHYIDKRDSDTQAILMCIQTNNVITDGKPFGFETDEFYFKSTSEMQALFAPFKDAVANTVKIAEKCNFDFEFDKLHLPDFTPEDGLSHKEKIRKDAYRGFSRLVDGGRLNFNKNPESIYRERLEYELSVIDKMGFNAYYLIVADFVSYAKRSGIPVGPGRGSGAGSLVAYTLGITDVDPIEFDLLFERFLNPERVSMPDFDIDFCYNRREEVIEYVKSRYGADKVAQIVTFGTLAARAVVRDVGRALGMPYNRVDTIAKLIPREMNVTINSALKVRELKEIYDTDNEVRRLLDISKKLEGMPRHASTHAAGVVITEKPTWEYVPLSYSGTGVVTQFDMTTDAKLGLVKFDFLGLRYLTIISDAEMAIKEKNPDFSVLNIPLDDKETFKLLSDAKTEGVFQLESGGMKQVLSKLSPTTLEDIIACIALYRPGPMDSIDSFIARKHGKEKVEYKIPELKEILDVTYGCIIYQEQVMQISRALAGYSYAKADILRRAMSKKDSSVMLAEREAFISGCIANGVNPEYAEEIFNEMLGFAKYAFNKSHATAYGLISYRTAYLKAHYPAEYFSALLTSVLDSAPKLREYIQDAQKHGVSVLPPDINYSKSDFSVSDGNIRYGLLAIRNVGRNFSANVVKERELGGIFFSFEDFVRRLSGTDLNKRTLESLIKCGVFDSFGITRSSLLASFEIILSAEQDKMRNNVKGQMDLFSLDGAESLNDDGFKYPEMKEFSQKELLLFEKEASGMYFSGHMIDSFSRHIEKLRVDRISDIINDMNEENFAENKRYKDKMKVSIAGVITAKRTKALKNGDTMAFISVEDKLSEIEVIVFAKQYSRFLDLIIEDNAVYIEGNISEEEGDAPKILLSNVLNLKSNSDVLREEELAAKKPERKKSLYVKVDGLSDKRLEQLMRASIINPGDTAVVVFDKRTKKYSAMKDTSINPTESVILKLKKLFGEDGVVLS